MFGFILKVLLEPLKETGMIRTSQGFIVGMICGIPVSFGDVILSPFFIWNLLFIGAIIGFYRTLFHRKFLGAASDGVLSGFFATVGLLGLFPKILIVTT